VHEAAMIASRFISFSAEIGGVRTEVLAHPEHAGGFKVLAPAGEEIRSWTQQVLEYAEEVGLPYPYDGFTLVETPTVLRGFAGGWRLDTALAPPGMMLMRESGLPTARFDVAFKDPEDWQDQEGGMARAMRERLLTFFRNDFSGGNLLTGASRNFLLAQTSAAGPEAIALNFVLEELASQGLAGSQGYFSAHTFTPEINQAISSIIQTQFTSGRPNANFAASVIDVFASRPTVWSAVMAGSLRDLDPWADPAQTVDALTLKAGALAKIIADGLGRETTARLLAEIRDQHRGGNFGLADVVAIGDDLEQDLGRLLDDWLTTTDLPGYVADEAQVYRLPDGDDGNPRYQLLSRFRNSEPVPGVVRVHYVVGEGRDRQDGQSDPIRVAGETAVQYGTILSRPPSYMWMEPYLSLNRTGFRVEMTEVKREEIVHEPPFEGTREVDWVPEDAEFIIVDDLDEGFAVIEGDDRSGVRLGGRGADVETDQGLPIYDFGRFPSRWARSEIGSGWGRYRHTVALVRSGKGSHRAAFTARLPHSGSWELEIHLPFKQRYARGRWGTWELEVEDSSGRHEVTFAAAGGTMGWNAVQTLELADGEVTVELSNRTDGRLVIADAIRWIPAAGNAQANTLDGG
jgi:hypothetical protein